MTSQSGKQTISTQILPNIPRSGDNHAMKFGQLIKYNKRNLSLETSLTKYGEGTIPKPYSKKSNLSILRIKSLKFYTVCFLLEGHQKIVKLK